MDQVMHLLDPPIGHGLSVAGVSRAYSALLFLLEEEEEEGSTVRQHARVQTIRNISRDESRHNFPASSLSSSLLDWLQQQTDLYRALLVASYLWLELGVALDEQLIRTLQQNMERSILLLQVLLGATLNSNAWKTRLPPSSYPLLQAALDPSSSLIPLNRDERLYMYQMQRQKHGKAASTEGDDTEQHDHDDGSGDIVPPDRLQLQREEQELLRMAWKPIPTVTMRSDEKDIGGGEKGSTSSKHDTVAATSTNAATACQNDNFYRTVIRQGLRVVWRAETPTSSTASSSTDWRPCTMTLYACGAVVLAMDNCDGNDDERQVDYVYYFLTQYSTCKPELDPPDFYLVLQNCMSLSDIHSTVVSLTFRMNSLEEGRDCIVALQKQVIGPIKSWAKLQRELEAEWEDEYRTKCRRAWDDSL